MVAVRILTGLWLALVLCSALGGCSSGDTPDAAPVGPGSPGTAPADTPVAQPFSGAWPSPAELLASISPGDAAQRSASYVPGDLVKFGDEYDPDLPSNSIYLIGSDLALDSWLEPAECTLADVAFASYHFAAPDFDGIARIRLAWTDEPLQPDYWFVALANWDADRWDWYTGNASNRIVLPDMDRYLAFGGNLVAVVCCTGPLNGLLHQVSIGGVEPSARLTAGPTRGTVPHQVLLNAVDSQAVEGSITKFEWDFDGDGIYDADTGTTDHISHTYTENGEYHPRVKVTNSQLAWDTDTAVVEAIGDWTHTWGFELEDYLYDVLQTSDGSIFATGYVRNAAGALDKNLLLLRVSPTGIVVWAKSWDTGESELGNCIVQLEGGDLVVAGTVYRSGGNDVLVQRWTRTGQLVWSKRYGGTNAESTSALVAVGDGVFVAGESGSTASNYYDVFLIRLDPNGTHFWGYARDFDGATSYATGMCPLLDSNNQLQGVIMVGYSDEIISQDLHSWKLEYFEDGILRSARILAPDDTLDVGIQAVVQVPAAEPAGERLYTVAELEDEFGRYLGLLCHNGLGSSVNVTRWRPTAGDCFVRGLVRVDPDTLVAGGWLDQGVQPGALWNIRAADAMVNDFLRWDSSPYYMDILGLCKSRYDGVVLAGTARNASGSWQPASGTVASYEWDWTSTAALAPIALEWTWDTDIAGSIEEIREALGKSADDGEGENDLMLAHRML